MSKSFFGTIFCLIVILSMSSCTVFRSSTPVSFGEYPTWRGQKSVSPEGVMFTVRQVDNKPYAKLSFWREAMRTQMERSGYVVVIDSTIRIGGTDAALLELAAPINNIDYSYLIAIATHKKKIIIAESSGEVVLFQNRKEDILKAITAITLK